MKGGPLRLLLVEDDDLVRRAVVRALERDGAAVVAVGCCTDAREAGVFDFGVLDVDLPDGDGVELARELLDGGCIKQVVFFTGGDPARARAVGPVILKGSGLDELQGVVAAARRWLIGDQHPIADHLPGWCFRHEQRMHVEIDGTTRIWLEHGGERMFEVAAGDLSDRIKSRVEAERELLETQWIAFMVSNNWIDIAVDGSSVMVTAYPGADNTFTRKIDLRTMFPGAYPSWGVEPPVVDLDREHALLRVGTASNPDHRNHIDMSEFMFVG